MKNLTFLHNDDLGKLLLRLTLGILLVLHGIHKIQNPTGAMGFISGQLTSVGLPGFLAYGAYIGELIAPILIIIGLYSRLASIAVIGNMLFAIGLVHMHELFSLTKMGGWALELQGFFLFSAVAIVFLGSGRFAVKAD